MGILRELSRVITGSAPRSDQTAALRGAYEDCLRRAARLQGDATVAPGPGSRAELLALARTEQDLAERLWESLADREPAVPASPRAPAPRPQRSHWARLVEDLEAHRAASQHCRDMATRLTDRSPETAALFDQLSQAQAGLCKRLRALIARADPQAID